MTEMSEEGQQAGGELGPGGRRHLLKVISSPPVAVQPRTESTGREPPAHPCLHLARPRVSHADADAFPSVSEAQSPPAGQAGSPASEVAGLVRGACATGPARAEGAVDARRRLVYPVVAAAFLRVIGVSKANTSASVLGRIAATEERSLDFTSPDPNCSLPHVSSSFSY